MIKSVSRVFGTLDRALSFISIIYQHNNHKSLILSLCQILSCNHNVDLVGRCFYLVEQFVGLEDQAGQMDLVDLWDQDQLGFAPGQVQIDFCSLDPGVFR